MRLFHPSQTFSLEDWKKNVLEYKIDPERRWASKTIPYRYWKTRWIPLISAGWISAMVIENRHELSSFSSTLITDGIVFRLTHAYDKTEILVEKCCIWLLYWYFCLNIERNRGKISKSLLKVLMGLSLQFVACALGCTIRYLTVKRLGQTTKPE
jgi:hypothetical protein